MSEAIDRKVSREVVAEYLGMVRAFQHRRSVAVSPKDLIEAGEVMRRLLDEIDRLDAEIVRLQQSRPARFAERMASRNI